MTVRPLDELRDLIPRFLVGKLSPQENEAFRLGISEYPELNNETEELKNLKAGLDIYEQAAQEHIRSEDIVAYARTSQELSGEVIAEIENHLTGCGSCREAADLSRKAFAIDIVPKPQEDRPLLRSLLRKLQEFLFPPRLVFRPIYAYVALLLLILPAYLGIHSLTNVGESAAVVDIHTSGLRGASTENIAVVDQSTRTLQLKFPAFPAKRNHLYNLQLRDMDNRVVVAWYGKSMTASTVCEVSTASLTAAQYSLEIDELDESGAKVDTFAPVVLNINHVK